VPREIQRSYRVQTGSNVGKKKTRKAPREGRGGEGDFKGEEGGPRNLSGRPFLGRKEVRANERGGRAGKGRRTTTKVNRGGASKIAHQPNPITKGKSGREWI